MKQTTQFPFYRVEFYNDQLSKRANGEQITTFAGKDLLQARKDALEFAFKCEDRMDLTPSPKTRMKYQHVSTMVSLEIGVYLVVSDTEEYQVFGDSIHETLAGLNAEACYFTKHHQLKSSQLRKIWQNSNERNGSWPLHTEKPKQYTIDKFIEIEVLKEDFESIAERSLELA